MSGKKNALFIINGYGLGNATRCEGLMDIVADQFEFDVITSDKAYRFFEQHPKVRHLIRQSDINLKSRFCYGSFLFFARYTFAFFPRLLKNYRLQKKIMKKSHYDVIIFDSDYSFIFHRVFGNDRLIGLNNSFEILQFFKRNPSYLKPSIWLSYLVEVLDYSLCKIFLHFTICPAISWNKLQNVSKEKLLVAPLLVRSKVGLGETSDGGKIHLIPSSSGEESSIQTIGRMITNIEGDLPEFEKDNTDSLKRASVIFCNAGQSSIAECLYLRKPAVLFPIPKHSEQLANAILAEKESLVMFRGQGPSDLIEICKKARQRKDNTEWDYLVTKKYFEKIFMKIMSLEARK